MKQIVVPAKVLLIGGQMPDDLSEQDALDHSTLVVVVVPYIAGAASPHI